MKKYILPLILMFYLIFAFNTFAQWDISIATYDEKSKHIEENVSCRNIFFKPDGSKMYIVGDVGEIVFQYSLSTPWVIDTATYDEKSKDVTTEDSDVYGISFKPDGTKMYIVGNTNNTIFQYTLSTPWDVSTASYDDKSFVITTQDTTPKGVFIKSGGAKMYIIGSQNDAVYQYTLSTAWDVSTASYDDKSKNITDEDMYPYDVFFSTDGTKMYMIGSFTDSIYQYTLSTIWDVSTASYANKFKDLSAEDISPHSCFFKPDGSKMYIMGDTNDTVYQYSLPPAPPAVNALFFGTNF